MTLRPLSCSTIYRILSVCGATVRKSLQGLDYFAAEGGKGFDDLAGDVTDSQFTGLTVIGSVTVRSR